MVRAGGQKRERLALPVWLSAAELPRHTKEKRSCESCLDALCSPHYLGGTICWIRDKQEGTPPKENQLICMTSASEVVTALEGFQLLPLAATLTGSQI